MYAVEFILLKNCGTEIGFDKRCLLDFNYVTIRIQRILIGILVMNIYVVLLKNCTRITCFEPYK